MSVSPASITAAPSALVEPVRPSAEVARTRAPARAPIERGVQWVAERRCGRCLSDAGATSDEQ
jgi:hypothetical protein